MTPAEVTSEQRRYAKVINFGLIYGMSAHGLAMNLGIDRAAAQGWIDRYFARYPGVAAYMDRVKAEAKERGYVETVFGRRLYLPEIRAQQVGRRQAAERAAINAPMQGTAADLIKKAMIAVHGWLASSGLKTRLILQVHDELVLEVPRDELERVRAELPAQMCGVATWRCRCWLRSASATTGTRPTEGDGDSPPSASKIAGRDALLPPASAKVDQRRSTQKSALRIPSFSGSNTGSLPSFFCCS